MSYGWNRLAPGSAGRFEWRHSEECAPATVLAARGRIDGPTLLVTAGVHGDEYEGPAAIARFWNELDTSDLAGRVLAIPVANTAAWEPRTRLSAIDGKDLNRLFPGDATGTGSDALAHAIFETFVRPSEIVVDLHSGGAALTHLPMVGWYEGDTQAESVARIFGTAFSPWRIPDAPGVLSREARRAGKVAIGAEYAGGAGLNLAGANAYASGLMRALAFLGMRRSDEPLAVDDRKAIEGDYQSTTVVGLFLADVDLGDAVGAGASIGRIVDAGGDVLAMVDAARSGIVAGLAHRPWLFAGDRVAYVG